MPSCVSSDLQQHGEANLGDLCAVHLMQTSGDARCSSVRQMAYYGSNDLPANTGGTNASALMLCS